MICCYTFSMPVPYSLDLRLRVLEAIDSGMNKMTVHKTFQVSRSTIDHWQKRRKATGSVAPQSGFRRGVLPAITDLKQFEAFAQRHSSLTLVQMAEAWYEETGYRLSPVTMSKTLKRIGWTRKKRAVFILNDANTSGVRFSKS